jgi:hypothetical protein
MNQDSTLTQTLAESQERKHAEHNHVGAFNALKTEYRIYTESKLSTRELADVVARYFEGATIYSGIGLDSRTQDTFESAVVVEIVSSKLDSLQRALDLAGDLRVLGNQASVLVSKRDVHTFEVTEQPTARTHARATAPVEPGESPSYNARSRAQAHRLTAFL